VLEVGVVSAHPLVLEGFRSLLAEPAFQIQAIRSNGVSPPDFRLVHPSPSIFVVDAFAPVAAIATLARNIIDRFPQARMLAVTENQSDECGFVLLRAGVRGLLTCSEALQRLPEACRVVAAGELWVRRAMLSRFLDWSCSRMPNQLRAAALADVSQRGQAVLSAVLDNLSNKEIADRLHISERTVKFHISRLFATYGVHHRSELIVRFLPYRAA
jgi:DNA-binding NarL/FixJ family response regulator